LSGLLLLDIVLSGLLLLDMVLSGLLLLDIVLSGLLRFTASDYFFVIFKLFLLRKCLEFFLSATFSVK
jgi:hypothetical protein